MAQEAVFLAVLLVTGAYLAWSLAESLSVRTAGRALTPYAASCSSPLWLAVLLVPVLLVSRERYSLLRKTRIHKTQPAPVFPHRDAVLGTDWVRLVKTSLQTNSLLETWHGLFMNSVGSTFWVNALGSWVLMTCDPENVKAVLADQFEAWPIAGMRQRALSLVLGPHAIFSTNADQWARARALIRPSFVRNQIADLECMDRHVENLLAKLLPPRGRGEKVDLQVLFYMFTMDMSTDFMFGHSIHMLVSPSKEAVEFTKAFDYALLSATSRARMGWLLTLLPDKRLDESVARCRTFISRHVAAALAQDKVKERPYVFMNELLDSGATHEQITDQLLAMILGGRDTSASTLSSLFWKLARRPEVVRSLRSELAGLDGRRPTWEDLKGLKYLNNVLKEALRLWPPVPSNMRTASRDMILPRGGGPDGKSPLFVPKGTECRYSTYSLQRRKDIYGEDAEEFRPERWETLRTSWEYVPFSGGPRICIGQQFALTMMSYLTARFFQVFDKMEGGDELPMAQMASSTISLVNGCWVSLTPASGYRCDAAVKQI
ncbi:cytochrome p450 [Hirsutella rhossiliensis]|uniref:Cytochrome p450 domain-containing protein n=1 Tax=Hirsutella rhossiliensis TaxID=111463 RepID=A0A9P8MWN1_9HYPO|nr:cytochrome p450 domain-containing protein [Hirsutella rhossiliensis]KAH0962732.1 cytochrome p450 domain-containing protein [Hirsutella rhossiliensis]